MLEPNSVSKFLYNEKGLAPRIEESICFDGSFCHSYCDKDDLTQH